MRRRWSVTAAAVLSAGALVVSGLPGQADLRSDKARIDDQVQDAHEALEGATAEAHAIGAALAQAEAELAAARADATKARDDLAAAQAEEAVALAAERAAEQALDEAKVQAAEAEARVLAAMDRIDALARAAYTTQSLDALSIALSGASPSELPARLGMLEAVATSNRRILADVAIERSRLTYARSVIADQETGLQAQREQAQEASRSAAAMAEALTAAEAEVVARVAEHEAAARAAESVVAQEQARLDDLESESARLSELIQGSASTTPRQNPGARLYWPTAGGIVSTYGLRFHPILHYWRLHAGADIGGAMGNPIFAAESGTVIWAGTRGGLGNATLIDHGRDNGRSLVTVYAHQSSISVQVGQRVSRGQLIGRVGATGLATAPHLHFEVRLNGATVDPAPWLR